jgi:hypothetical protein
MPGLTLTVGLLTPARKNTTERSLTTIKSFNSILKTVNQLKTGNLTDLDIENLIEEIDSIGRNDKRET